MTIARLSSLAKEGHGIQELVETIEKCEPQNTRGKMMMMERLISEWDSILVSHPEIDKIISELCDGSITVREAIEILVSSVRDGVRKCHQMETTYS